MHAHIQTKICGISTHDAVDAVIEGGADYIGFIFFEKSPRHVTTDLAEELAGHVANSVVKVAVSVNADDAYLDQIVSKVSPDILQLHGSESPQRVREIKHRFQLPVMKAFAIRDQSDLEKTAEYEGIADRFLFDAKPPAGSDLPGGNGVSFDWTLLQGLKSETPFMLSGGLDLSNVETAVRHSFAVAIDVSSGVESSPGVKDCEKIRALLEHVRSIDVGAAA